VTIEVLVIGIGTGNLEHLTQEAVRALNQVDVFLVADKGPAKDDLVELRNEICRTFISHDRYRVLEVPDPERGSDRDREGEQYRSGVEAWHQQRAQRYADLIRSELGGTGTVGFLVWGDPAFYDSSIRVVERIRATGTELSLKVIPGISSLQLLAARHQIALNRIGQPIHVTTGRRLLAEYDPRLGDVAVMLDGELACAGLAATYPDLQIFWGAQLGLPDEVLVRGRLSEVVDELGSTRRAVRQRRGWVMDTYLLRP
jgi:precorrin-6A synthase